eukprot:2900455-Pleurochrysis_carterae.AAC.1
MAAHDGAGASVMPNSGPALNVLRVSRPRRLCFTSLTCSHNNAQRQIRQMRMWAAIETGLHWT